MDRYHFQTSFSVLSSLRLPGEALCRHRKCVWNSSKHSVLLCTTELGIRIFLGIHYLSRISFFLNRMQHRKDLEGQRGRNQANTTLSVMFIAPSTLTNVCSTLPPSGIIIFITKLMQEIIIRMQSFYFLLGSKSSLIAELNDILSDRGQILQFITHPSVSAECKYYTNACSNGY